MAKVIHPTSNRIAKVIGRCAIAFLSAHIPCPLLALTGECGRKLGGGVNKILLVPSPTPPELCVASVHFALTHVCGCNAAQKWCAALNQVQNIVGLGGVSRG
jgi:hypothetical protein